MPTTPSPANLSLSELTQRAPGQLQAWPGNARQHSPAQLTKLKASVKRFGFTVPLIVDEADVVLSGHGRLEAAKQLHLATVPVRIISGLTQAEKRAYVLADNKLAMLSTWDVDLLKAELSLLVEDEFEIEVTGFTTAEVDLMFGEDAQDTDDPQPEDVVESSVSAPGDLWVLGDHRLLCGDALVPASYATLMQGSLAQMAITDPPYNVKIDGHVCGNGKVQHAEFAMASGEMTPAEFTAFLQRALSQISANVVAGSITFVAMDWRHLRELQDAAKPVFGAAKQLCVWVKDNAGMGTFYRSQHELFVVFKKGDVPHVNNFELGQHGRYRTNVWSYPGANAFKGKGLNLLALHPTVKPVPLIADAIRDCSHRNGLILDPFAGSGTILIAAERTGRCARAIELDPKYVDVAVRRWQRLTEREAVLESTGQSWDEVRDERADEEELT
jgi:DNA modification methylase